MSRKGRLAALMLLVVFSGIILPNLLHYHGIILELWQKYRALIEQFVLFLAVMTALTAVVAGVVTWRRERRNHA